MNEQRLAIRMLERRLAEQEAEIKRLHATVARLLSENEKLRAENAELRAEIARLQAENAELRRRLEMNSSNSHKPPSSDGYRKKRVQPALPKGRSSAPGGQAGHEGKTLRAVEKPDKTVVHLPKQCRLCGRAIGADEPHRVVGQTPGVRLAGAELRKSPNTAWAKSNARAGAGRGISGVCDQHSAIRAWGTGVGDQTLGRPQDAAGANQPLVCGFVRV